MSEGFRKVCIVYYISVYLYIEGVRIKQVISTGCNKTWPVGSRTWWISLQSWNAGVRIGIWRFLNGTLDNLTKRCQHSSTICRRRIVTCIVAHTRCRNYLILFIIKVRKPIKNNTLRYFSFSFINLKNMTDNTQGKKFCNSC